MDEAEEPVLNYGLKDQDRFMKAQIKKPALSNGA